MYIPGTTGCSYDMSSPEFIGTGPDDFIDPAAHDVYSTGILLLMLYTDWTPDVSDRTLPRFRQNHIEWVSAVMQANTACCVTMLHAQVF